MSNVVALEMGPVQVRTCAGCGRAFSSRATHARRCASCTRRRPGSSREGLALGARARTENISRLPKRELRLAQLLEPDADEAHAEKPCTRGGCADVPRPCPFVSCRYNLFLDVDEGSGNIKYNFPDREPDQMDPEYSCALDVAERGGATLEDVGLFSNVTRERIRQIETKVLGKLRKRAKVLREYSDAPEGAEPVRGESDGGSIRTEQPRGAEREERVEEEEPPTRISFFSMSEKADDQVCRSVWTMLQRNTNSRRIARERGEPNDASAERPPITEGRETTMAMTKEMVADAHAAWTKKHGRAPTAAELFDVLGGEDVASSLQNVRNSCSRQGLSLGNGRFAEARAPAAAKPAALPAPRAATAAPAPRATSKDPLVVSMIERRDQLRGEAEKLTAKAAQLDKAIEDLSEAL